MIEYQIHRIDTAPPRSKALLQELKDTLGMVPDLAAAMSESPELLEGFLRVRQIYSQGSFTPQEIQVLSLTAAVENSCAWCVAFHTLLAHKEGVSSETIAALRDGRSPVEERVSALSDFARAMVRQRGALSAAELERFLAAGYTKAQALEVVLGMAFSLMANYAGHITNPLLNAALEPYAWHALAHA